MIAKITAFQRKCEKVAADIGIGVCFDAEEQRREAFEDDGTLHIARQGIRAMFDVSHGQSLEGKEQNEYTRKICAAMKIEVAENMLAEEGDEEESGHEGACPHCGRF